MGSANGVRSTRIDPEKRQPRKAWQRASDQQQKVKGRLMAPGQMTDRQARKLAEGVARRLRNDARREAEP